ncbi:SGNH/GDSL hydrolase family protein [Halopseudomonas maritima]|uniref:SGNH/GDSL hydrolase family protein n=1 Tax=Halopseudomonas maritima TaxID=2918528 RepID=UPI001EEBA13B|nr:SGNH/GDSL hydrolase family protein [Halopseudomonas maritima]
MLLPQAIWVKRTALRLPDAAAPWQGVVPAPAGSLQAPLRLLLIGESTVAGVGVDCQRQALSGQLALQLSQQLGRAVQWQAAGRNGAVAADCLQDLLPQVVDRHWDLALIVLGVNDTTHLTPRPRWRRNLQSLVEQLNGCVGQVMLTEVPPLGHFRALPQPLRGWFGLRAGLMNRDVQQVAAEQGAGYLSLDMPFEAHYLARDGYHPSAEGYRLWAAGIVRQLALSEPAVAGASVGAG